MAALSPGIEVLGVHIAQLTGHEALEEVARLHERPGFHSVAFVNAHTLNLAAVDPGYRAVLNRCGLVLNDGSGLALAARLQGKRFPENLNGTDFNPRLLQLAADRGWRVFFLGGKPGVADTAAAVLRQRIPGLRIAGTRDGYFGEADVPAVVAQIRSAGASLLLVAMGNPIQEQWLDAHLAETGCRMGVGVGAFLDFSAGNVPRAPDWVRRIGFEWLYRLFREPGRLWRRYVLGNPVFVWRVVRAWIRGTRLNE